MPLGVAAGVLALAVVVVFLILQASGSSGEANAEWIKVEADPAPGLPGVYVNLPEIYGGPYGTHGENATAGHVLRDIDYVADGNTSPPAGGPHWGQGSCPDDPADAQRFCGPAPWGIYRQPWEPEVLVHNIEHGGVVIWYNTTDQAVIDEIEALALARLRDGDILVMAPYDDMEDEQIALTSWARIDSFPVADYEIKRIEDYIDAHVRRFNPEAF